VIFHYATAMALSSLISGGFAWSVPTMSILIWNLVNGGNSLELKL